MARISFNFFRRYGILLILPGIQLGYSILLKLATGPYWLATNSDPSYQYIVNGLHLVKGLVPNHSDHPGTPLQLLCALICWIFNIGHSSSDIVIKGLSSPEFYLHAVFVVLMLFSFLTSFALAAYVFRTTKDVLAAVLTQLPALSFLVLKSWETSEAIIPVVANVAPEPLLISVVNLFNIFLLRCFFAKTSRDEFMVTLWLGGRGQIDLYPSLGNPVDYPILEKQNYFHRFCYSIICCLDLAHIIKVSHYWRLDQRYSYA